MNEGMVNVSYIIATILFILALGGLSNQETARRGNWYGIIGMTIALLATVLSENVYANYDKLIIALLIGGSALVWRQQRDLRHAAMAESLAKFSDTTAVPGVEVLRDFAAIQRLSQTLVSGDEELAAALAGGEQ